MDYDLIREIESKTHDLEVAIRSLRKTGQKRAETERDYKIILRQEALKLRDSGMAVGMIDKTVYGIEAVAAARYERDVAEAVYAANLESINATKLMLRLLDAQISREWGGALHD